MHSKYTLRKGGEQGILPQEPQTLRGPMRLLFHDFHLSELHLHTFSLSQHCLNSMNECLDSNATTVRVDKHFDACKHAEPTPLSN